MRHVHLQAHLKPHGGVKLPGVSDERPPDDTLAIRVMITPKDLPIDGPTGPWTWALVRTHGPHAPDTIIVGGFAEDLTEASARGVHALNTHLKNQSRS
jgi:hypothetical protein